MLAQTVIDEGWTPQLYVYHNRGMFLYYYSRQIPTPHPYHLYVMEMFQRKQESEKFSQHSHQQHRGSQRIITHTYALIINSFWHEGLNRIISVGKTNIFFISLETYPILIHFPIDMKIYQIRDICKRSSEPLSLNMYFNWKEKWIWNMEGDSLFRCMGSNVFMM